MVPGGGHFDYGVDGPYSTPIGWDEYKNGAYVEPTPSPYIDPYFWNLFYGNKGPWWNPPPVGYPGNIHFTSEFDGSWDVPVAIDPNIILGDIEIIIHWPDMPIGHYTRYLEGLGAAYDVVKMRWRDIGKIGAGSPVVRGASAGNYSFPQMYTGTSTTRTGKK